MMIKKMFSCALATCAVMATTLVPMAGATDVNAADQRMPVILSGTPYLDEDAAARSLEYLPLKITSGIAYYDEEAAQMSVETRATSKPTSYAPSSWYNTKHYWTADWATWTSYIFDRSVGPNFDVYAPSNKPFSVHYYWGDGTYMMSAYSVLNKGMQELCATFDGPGHTSGYYAMIENESSSSITSGAYYEVFKTKPIG